MLLCAPCSWALMNRLGVDNAAEGFLNGLQPISVETESRMLTAAARGDTAVVALFEAFAGVDVFRFVRCVCDHVEDGL